MCQPGTNSNLKILLSILGLNPILLLAVGGAVVKTYGAVHPGPVTTTYVKTYGPVHPAPAVGGEVFLAGRVGAVPHVGTVSKTVVATGGVGTAAGDVAVVKEVPAAAKVAVGGVAAVPAVGGAVVVAGQKSPEFYNNVFNIPISALNSVRDLLNNLG